jgi:hypothetical protein
VGMLSYIRTQARGGMQIIAESECVIQRAVSTHLSVSLIAVPAKSVRTNSGRVSWNGSRHKLKLSLSFIVVPVDSDTASGGCHGTEAGSKAFSIFQYRVVEWKYVSEKKLECIRSSTAVANAPLHIRQYHHAYTQY